MTASSANCDPTDFDAWQKKTHYRTWGDGSGGENRKSGGV